MGVAGGSLWEEDIDMSELDNVDADTVDAGDILEMSTEKLDEMNERKKKNSLLNEVLVTGLLKNINDKVSNKLDTDAQSELVNIINERVKDGYEGGPVDLESEIEKAISFDEGPTDDHIMSTANKNRAKLPANRRLPTKESKLSFSEIQEQLGDMEDSDKVDEDFDNLFKDDDITKDNQYVDQNKKCLKKSSYVDDFDALLADENEDLIDIEKDAKYDVDDDFDALLKAENIEIEPSDKMEKLSDIKAAGNIGSSEGAAVLPVEESYKEEMEEDRKSNEKVEKYKNESGKGNINDSLEDIFKSLEKTEPNLIEIENMLVDDSLDESGCKTNEEEKDHSEKMNDPFDDLFDELDEENLEDVDKGFEQLFEIKTNIAKEEKSS